MLDQTPLAPITNLAPDQYLICQNCGIFFVWTGWQQRMQDQIPDRCPGCEQLASLTRRQRGTVKWYDTNKGYGFLTGGDGSEIFVHRSSLGRIRQLRRGQIVAYEIEVKPGGRQATAVTLIKSQERRPRASRPGVAKGKDRG